MTVLCIDIYLFYRYNYKLRIELFVFNVWQSDGDGTSDYSLKSGQ